MKRVLFLILVAGLFIGCNNSDYSIGYGAIIPDSLKSTVLEEIQSILSTVKVHTRVDDEDMEDWISEARETVFRTYAVRTIGIYANYNFIPYKECSQKHKDAIDKYLRLK